jgi:hypothetical protein
MLSRIRKVWNVSKEILFGSPAKEFIVDRVVGADSRLIMDKKDIANEFNQYFVSIGEDLANKLLTDNHNLPFESTMSYDNPNNISFYPVSEEEVVKTVNELKSSSSAGFDKITVKFLKDNINLLLPHLVNMINDSFKNNKFPDELKLARVLPIFKKGSKICMTNYRPISILSNVAKILERVIDNRLNEFYVATNFFHKFQYGFLPKSNSLAAATNLVHNLQIGLDKHGFCACVFIDVSKAFDCVDHKILIRKYDRSGVRNNELLLMEDYLNNRTQFVKIGDKLSEIKIIRIGVPQGSVLGPKSFLVFINDIFEIELRGKIQLFADDAVIFYCAASIHELEEDMQHDLDLIFKWFYNNKLSMNIDKTKYIIFKQQGKNIQNFNLMLGSKLIERVNEIVYLGLHLQENLKWNTQIDHIKSKILPLIGIFRKIFPSIPVQIRKLLYFAYIHSHFIYLNPIWNKACLYKLKELQVCQNKAMRNIFNEYYRHEGIHTADIFKKFKIPNLQIINSVRSVNLVYCIENGLLKNSIEFVRVGQSHTYETRTRSNLANIRARTNIVLNGVISHGITLFNALPENIRNENYSSFMNSVKKYYFDFYEGEI